MRAPSVFAGSSGFSLTCLSIGLGVATLVGCAASANREGFEDPPAAADKPGEPAPAPTGDFDTSKPAPKPEVTEIHEVYGHSNKVLYKLDPKTKDVTEVGPFQDCEPIIDIALDENADIWAVSYKSLFRVDKTTATCTAMPKATAAGDYPNSLSFVPKGTADDNAEALVGYEDADYVRIDPATGEKTKIGSLGTSGLVSSGDIVSVKGGSTYLTVKAPTTCKTAECKKCTTYDCLVEVDPSTGKLLKNWGSVEHKQVFGLSFWGGKIYGFDQSGELFEVTFGTTQLATAPISMASKPADLSFWGAGSSTSAPLTAPPQ